MSNFGFVSFAHADEACIVFETHHAYESRFLKPALPAQVYCTTALLQNNRTTNTGNLVRDCIYAIYLR